MPNNNENRSDESALVKLMDFLKKPADILDDLWNTVRKFVPEAIGAVIGAFLIGFLFFIIHLFEAYTAAKEIYQIYQNEQERQRKTRYITSLLSFVFAGAGVGLSLSLILGALSEVGVISLAVAGMAFFPIIIPGLIAGICALSLWKNSYVLHRAKEDEVSAKNSYEQLISEAYYDSVKADRLFESYQNAYNDRLKAEQVVALNAIELAGSLLVCTGILLGTAAAIGAASIMSFGVVPLVLLIAGVVIGTVSKWIEYKDEKQRNEKQDFPLTKRMRHFFRNLFYLPTDEPVLRHAPKIEKVQNQLLLKIKENPKEDKQAVKVIPESKHSVESNKSSTNPNHFWFKKEVGSEIEMINPCVVPRLVT